MVNNVQSASIQPAVTSQIQVKSTPTIEVKNNPDAPDRVSDSGAQVLTIQGQESSSSRDAKNEIEAAVDELNNRLENQEIQVAFGVDNKSGRVVVSITDSSTGELIRQVPSEETLEFARNVEKGVGLLLDNKI